MGTGAPTWVGTAPVGSSMPARSQQLCPWVLKVPLALGSMRSRCYRASQGDSGSVQLPDNPSRAQRVMAQQGEQAGTQGCWAVKSTVGLPRGSLHSDAQLGNSIPSTLPPRQPPWDHACAEGPELLPISHVVLPAAAGTPVLCRPAKKWGDPGDLQGRRFEHCARPASAAMVSPEPLTDIVAQSQASHLELLSGAGPWSRQLSWQGGGGDWQAAYRTRVLS